MAYGGGDVVVELLRDSLHVPWGFRIQGGLDFGSPITVQKVATLGSAEGILHLGDTIVEINNQDVRRATHQDATYYISSAGSRLILRIKRKQLLPPTTSRAPINKFRTIKDQEEEEKKVPTNKNLAKMMTTSLLDAESEKKGPGLHSVDLLFRHPNPNQDITSYLPKPNRPLRPSAGNPRRESYMRSAVASSVVASSETSSGRSTPTSMIEFGEPTNPESLMAVGVWTPPTHQPNARLVHLQYNSPLNMYSPHNVADMVQKQTGTKLSWQKKPPVRFLDDIRDSDTYKYVQETENPDSRARSLEPTFNQSTTFKNIRRHTEREWP